MSLEGYKERSHAKKDELYKAVHPQNIEKLNIYLQFLQNAEKKKSTLNVYEGDILNFMLFIEKDITRVSEEELEKYIAFLKESKKITNRTINRHIAAIKGIVTYFSPNSN